MAKKCPLCGGKLKNNYCESCGYAVPDDNELSALYNLDPSDYPEPQEQPAVREIIPDAQAEEIYPNRPGAPKFKVRDDKGKTVQGDYGQNAQSANPYVGQSGQQTPPPSYYANDAGRTPPPSPYASPPSPYANTGNTSGSNNKYDWNQWFSKELIKEFASKYWWYLALVIGCPFVVGAVITVAMMTNVIDKKYRAIAVAALVLSLFLPPY